MRMRATIPAFVVAAPLAVAALLAVAPGSSAAGQDGAPGVTAAIQPAQIAVGDRARLTIRVEHDPGASVVWPEPDALGPFEVLERRIEDALAEDGRGVSSAEFSLTAFELGELELPAVEIEVLGGDGSTATLGTDPMAVTVTSVGRDEGGDIRAIKGPLDIPRNLLLLLPWLAGFLLLAGLAAWLWRRYRARSTDGPVVPAVPPRPAHEIAYEAFRALEAERLPESGEIKTFHIRASDIVRAYVEGRFGVQALEMTTGEVLDGLRGHEVEAEVGADLRRLLERCDLVKFARDRPSLERCREVIPLGRSLVDRTRVVVAPTEPAVGVEPAPVEAGSA